jgi:acyl-CoA thioester hydrolase
MPPHRYPVNQRGTSACAGGGPESSGDASPLGGPAKHAQIYILAGTARAEEVSMPHSFTVKVYYEDTDAGGVVYYANYLRFMERARTEYMAELGVDVPELHNRGMFLVVTHLDISYRRPAHLGETLEVTTELAEAKRVKVTLRQRVLKEGTLLVDALLSFACVDGAGKPQRLPTAFEGVAASDV